MLMLRSVISVIVILSFSAFATGDEPADRQPDDGSTRSDEARLNEILEKWEDAYADVHSARTKFLRYEYDMTFHVEKRSKGELIVQLPDRFESSTEPVEITETVISKKIGANGQPYQVETVVTVHQDQSR